MTIKIIATLFLSIFLSSSIYANTTQSTTGNIVINLAGKQRMLTQKMSKEALLIIKGIEIEKNKQQLKETIALFDLTLKGLKNGNDTLQLPQTEEKEILKHIEEGTKLWNLFKIFLDKIVEGNANKETLKAVEIANMPLLKVMDRIVHLYEKKYKSKRDPNIAKTINISGKERMLIQKMTKELLLIANNIKSDTYIKSLQSGGKLFQTRLSNLIKDKKIIKDHTLIKRVEAIQELWEKYQNNIMNAELSPSGLKVFKEKESAMVQKMTKELVDVALLIDAQRYQINLTQTEYLFDTTLKALIHGDKEIGIKATSNKEIQEQLQKVLTLWKEYQPIISAVDTSKKGLLKAMKINMPLLQEMDKAVKLYEINLK